MYSFLSKKEFDTQFTNLHGIICTNEKTSTSIGNTRSITIAFSYLSPLLRITKPVFFSLDVRWCGFLLS